MDSGQKLNDMCTGNPRNIIVREIDFKLAT